MPVSVRAMAERDLDRAMEIAASLETAPQWPRAAYEAAIAAEGMPRRIALVAEIDGEIAGFAVASRVGAVAELESIAVVAGWQGRGIGRTLLDWVIAGLRMAGVTELELGVRESNQAAAKLYRRAGFFEAGRRRGYYRDPVEDAVLLRRLLA